MSTQASDIPRLLVLTNTLKTSFIVRGVFILVSWLLVWQIGRLMEYTEHASVWFPASGFTFSCLLVIGRRAYTPIMVAAILTTIWNGHHYSIPLTLSEFVWAGLLFGLAHIFPYWTGAALLGRISRKPDVHTPQLIVSFLVIACIASLITTVLVITSLVLTNQMSASDVEKTLLPFWIGDMAGVVVLAPLFTALLNQLMPKSLVNLDVFTKSEFGSKKSAANKIGLNLVLIFLTMLLAYVADTKDSSFAIFFLAVTHMWIACTESPKFNVISLAVSSVFIVVLVHFFDLMDYIKVYQFAINVIAANALFGIAIPQLQADNRQLKDLVFIDKLTGAYSRAYMEQRGELEVAQSHELKSPLYLVVFDLDKFKLINDELGHMAGDEALRKFSLTIRSKLRKTDLFARFGGDEFVLLIAGLGTRKTQTLIEEIRASVRTVEVRGHTVSSSFGVAKLLPGDSFDGLFHRADIALYKAKKAGGDTIKFTEDT